MTLTPYIYYKHYSQAKGYRMRLLSCTFSQKGLSYKMPTMFLKHSKEGKSCATKCPCHFQQVQTQGNILCHKMFFKKHPLFLHFLLVIQKQILEPLSASPAGVHPTRFLCSSSEFLCEMRQFKHIFWSFQEVRPKSSIQKRVCYKSTGPGLGEAFPYRRSAGGFILRS